MARPLRIQFPGAVYHVSCRGNEKKNIFEDDGDRQRFLKILTQSLHIYTVKLHSYVLMANHFHLLAETPLGNLAEFMRRFNIVYTGYFNRRHRRTGHLYQGRYKSVLVDKETYLAALSRYIHLNPVRIKAMEKAPLEDRIKEVLSYRWSSLPGYLSSRKRERLVEYGLVLSEYGGDTRRARKAYRKALYGDLTAGLAIKDKIVGQSILGGNEFIESIREGLLRGEIDRERPSLKEIHKYRTKNAVLILQRRFRFDSFGHSEAFFPMRFIRDIIAARMIPDNFDRSLERQRTKREDGCDQSVSLGKRQRWSFF